jgi:hypothetical protein
VALGTAHADTILLKPVPSLTGGTVQPNTVADQASSVSMQLNSLKAGTQVAVLPPSATATGTCKFVYQPGMPLPTGAVPANGVFAFAVKGSFTNTGADPTGPCSISVRISRTDLAGKPGETAMVLTNLRLTQPQTYVFANTKAWKSRLNFAMTESQGTCTGRSTGPAGTHDVGFLVQGNDLFFKIRSGPLGTECTWKSQAQLLPSGVKLTGISFQIFRDTRCEPFIQGVSRSGGALNAQPQSFAAISTTNPVLTATGAALAPNPNGAGALAMVLQPVVIHLQCGGTVVNDREVNIQIDSFSFTGPPGLTFP